MKKNIQIIFVIILLSGLILFLNYEDAPGNTIIGNVDFEPTLDITSKSFFKRIRQLNEKNEITIEPEAFTINKNQLKYPYNNRIKIQANLYSDNQIGDLLIIASHDLTENELEKLVNPLAHFLIQCINETSQTEASKIIQQMDLSLENSSYIISPDTAYTYEFYYLKSHGYIFAIRSSAMGN